MNDGNYCPKCGSKRTDGDSEIEDEESYDWAELLYSAGYEYFTGRNMTQDYEKAIQIWKQAVDKGSSEAMFALGNAYYNGEGVNQDYQLAFEWYGNACNLGHANAMYNLARCYEKGDGVEKNASLALSWYEKQRLPAARKPCSK